MNNLEDLLLGVECDEFILDSLMYQKVSYQELGSLIDNGDGTYSQPMWDKVEPIMVSSQADTYIYRALRDIEKVFNTKL
jgi:hypothetical protein